MSDENIERLRRSIEAYNAREKEAWIGYFHSSVEFHSVFAAVGGGVYQGHDGLRRWWRDLEDAWGDAFRTEPETYFDLGDQTLVFNSYHGRGQHSDVEVAMPVALVFKWREGLIVYFKSYVDRAEALSDLGVSQSELKPIEP
jgi:ketosteroid isomerase-like protein